jgi:hypothetical protein
MTPRAGMKRTLAVVGGAVVLTLAWPGPTRADTTLGGYSGVASADAIHVEIFDPTIPLPSDPQIDLGIAHTKANTDSGPVSRALASYLWPGDVIGDGFDQLIGNPSSTYPVQINSRFPATSTAPAHNTAQITAGNGMTTSSDDTTSRASASGVGVSGQSANDPLKGLCQLLKPKDCPATPAVPQVPVNVSKQVSALVTMSGGSSDSTVTIGKNSITSTAHATGSGLKLLGGLITIGNVDITSKTVSDGKKAVTTGNVDITSVTIAGKSLGIDGKGLNLAGKKTKLPDVPSTITDLLSKIGISFDYAPTTRSVTGPQGSLKASGLVITVDTKLLHDALAPLTGVLADLLNTVPNMSQVTALLGLGPKFEFIVGDVSSAATASPAYVPPPAGAAGGSTGGSSGGGTGGSDGGGGLAGSGGSVGDTGGGPGTSGADTTSMVRPQATTPTAIQPVAYQLPRLSAVPRALILGALGLAGAIGWIFRGAGSFILGGGRNCSYGLGTGLPDLRKG